MPDEPKKTDTDDSVSKLKDANSPERVWEVIYEGLTNLAHLEIKTIVVDDVTGTEQAEKKELSTSIDLIQADRTTKIDAAFLKDAALAPLRDFHAKQVELAEQDIQKKIEFLKSLANGIILAFNNKKKT